MQAREQTEKDGGPKVENDAGPKPTFRVPSARDGAALYQLVRDAGTLELNSVYFYVLFADRFANGCAIAELDGRPVGVLIGFIPPEQLDTYFVWQVGVHPDARGHAIARRMIDHVVTRRADVRFIEATVAPNNAPSDALFRSVARHYHAELKITGGYPSTLFPGPHEAEHLYRIGPIEVSS